MSKLVSLVVAPYYAEITNRLVEGAQQVLHQAGYETQMIEVSGAFEIPAAIAMLHQAQVKQISGAKNWAGHVALGCVIRGETSHYDYVCEESARGLNQLAMEQHLAIGYGILTVENENQANARSVIKGRNKGTESAKACLAMMQLKNELGL